MTTTTTFQCVRGPFRTLFVALVALTMTGTAFGQTAQVADWHRGSTLEGFFGAQSASSHVSPAAGVGLGWEVARHLAIEGRGTWFSVNDGPSDFAATLAAHVPLTSFRRVVPFVAGGVGMYRATFDASSNVMPDFYRLRMPGTPGSHTFQDFLVTAGGGASVFVSDHFALRPEVNLMLVTTRADSRNVGVFGVQLIYHFEPHPTE